jgi:hypothetical protein
LANNMLSLPVTKESWSKNEFMDAMNYKNLKEKETLTQIIKEGFSLFKSIWGFNSLSFIAPFYLWFNAVEKISSISGVKFIQGSAIQLIPSFNSLIKFKKLLHYTGQRNNSGQIYLVRNVLFEPSENQNTDNSGQCLNKISNAFKFNKPAIIQSHRVNFIGSIDEANRNKNLKLLKYLLTEIVKRWPQTEFMTTPQLGELIFINK